MVRVVIVVSKYPLGAEGARSMPWSLDPEDVRRLVEAVKNLPSFGNDQDRKALLQEGLGLSPKAKGAVAQLVLQGANDVVAIRVITHLAEFGKLECGGESLELFLMNSVIPRVDSDTVKHINEILNKNQYSNDSPLPSPLRHAAEFDPRPEDVAKSIRTKLDKLKGCRLLDEEDREVWLLDLVSQELDEGGPSSGRDLSEHLASFLAGRRDVEHVGVLVSRVFCLLCGQGKEAEAKIIGDVVDLMLPLCLPRDVLGQAWGQLQGHGAVLIQGSVARKTGAEILVAGLFKKPTRWGTSSTEPTGEQLVGFEDVPIGDPDQNEESALRDLYAATYYPGDKVKGMSNAVRLTAAQMRKDLSGHYRSRRLGPRRPSYCAVEFAATESDRQNQKKLIANLAIPELLFVELKPDSETRELESFVIHCLSTRLGYVATGFRG